MPLGHLVGLPVEEALFFGLPALLVFAVPKLQQLRGYLRGLNRSANRGPTAG